MKISWSIRVLTTAAALALALGLGTQQAQAQVDGFAGHKIVAADGWRVKDVSDLLTSLGKPLAGGGAYQIELDAGAWFQFDGDPTKHYITKLSAFYQLYTAVGLPSGTDAPDPRPASPSGLPSGWAKDNPITNAEKQAWGYTTADQSYNASSSVLFPAGATGRTHVGSIAQFQFDSATPLSADNTVLFGFHLGWTDTPFTFNTNVDPTTNTANVYWQTEGGGPPIPEPAFYQLSGLLLLGGAGLFLRARRAKNSAS